MTPGPMEADRPGFGGQLPLSLGGVVYGPSFPRCFPYRFLFRRLVEGASTGRKAPGPKAQISLLPTSFSLVLDFPGFSLFSEHF